MSKGPSGISSVTSCGNSFAHLAITGPCKMVQIVLLSILSFPFVADLPCLKVLSVFQGVRRVFEGIKRLSDGLRGLRDDFRMF